MTEKRLSTIQVSERTLIMLAQLPFNKGTTTFEDCVNNLLRHYKASLNESKD